MPAPEPTNSTEQLCLGRCLCGDVAFTFSLPHVRFNYCHCESCRKASGASHAANILVARSHFKWVRGETEVREFTDTVNNPGFKRWFCSRCGGPVPRPNRSQEFMVIPAGLIETDLPIKPERNIYWCERAGWLIAPDDIPKYVEGIDSAVIDRLPRTNSVS